MEERFKDMASYDRAVRISLYSNRVGKMEEQKDVYKRQGMRITQRADVKMMSSLFISSQTELLDLMVRM